MTRSMESWTAWRVVRDLMLDAVPASSRSWPRTSCILRSGGTYRLMSSVPRPSFRASCSRVRLNLNLATESDADKTELVTGYSTSSEEKLGRWPMVLGRLVHILDFFFFPGLCFAHVLHILLTSPQARQVGFAYKPWPNREVFRFPCPIFSDSQFFAFRWVDPFGIVSL